MSENTTTDDERGMSDHLRRYQDQAARMCGCASCREWLAESARRTEAPEPSAEELRAVIAKAQSRFQKYASQEAPTYDDEVDALLDISRILSGTTEPFDALPHIRGVLAEQTWTELVQAGASAILLAAQVEPDHITEEMRSLAERDASAVLSATYFSAVMKSRAALRAAGVAK